MLPGVNLFCIWPEPKPPTISVWLGLNPPPPPLLLGGGGLGNGLLGEVLGPAVPPNLTLDKAA